MKKFYALFAVISIFLFATSCDGKKDDISDSAVCGDLLVTNMEKCDGENLDGQTCEILGFGAGTLSCELNCLEFDTSQCGASMTCGNDIKDGTDVCDGDDLGGETCVSRGYEDGTLKCLDNCAGFDTSQCGKSVTCGNGKIDSGEVCDDSELGGRTCEHEGFEEGELKCSDDCKSFDASDCYTPCIPECGDRVCGPDPVCGESCGECTGDWEICNDAGQCEKTCDLDPFDSDTSIEIDLKTVTVSGEITLNGSTAPDNTKEYYEEESRGSIGFINKQSGNSFYVGIGNSGKASFSVEIFEGTYDIVFNPNNSSYQNVFPDLNMKLATDIIFDKDISENFDLETVTVSGKITIDGKTMSDNTKEYYETESRGSVRFTNNDSGSSVSTGIGSSDEAAYSFKLYKGTYSVTFSPNSESYQNSIPKINMILDRNMEINSTVAKDFNLDTATVSGKVTINGSAIPSNTKEYYETEPRGTIYMSNVESGSTTNVTLGSSGEAAFSRKVFKGKYNFSLNPNNASYQNSMPPINMILGKDIDISADTTKNFNLETATVNGSVTLNGSTVPDNTKEYYEEESRGHINFTNKDSGDTVSISLGSSGEAAYSAVLFKGTYGVQLKPNNGNYQNSLPSLNINLDSKVDVNSDFTKNFNLETVTFSGKVTINGTTMSSNTKQHYETESRGNIRFKNKESGDTGSVDLGSKGEAFFSKTLYRGIYDVSLNPNNESYQDSMPGMNIVLENNLKIESTTEKTYNADTVTVSGNVKLNGQTMPGNTKEHYEEESRGSLVFRNKSSSDKRSVSIGSSGIAVFSVKLFNGSYDIDFSANNSSYQDVLPRQYIKIYEGCFDYSAGCDLDQEDITGTWEFIPEAAYWTPVTFHFIQNGEEITGTFESSTSSGSIEPGTRTGEQIRFQFKPYNDMTVEGNIVSGCNIIGRFDTIGHSGPNYDSDFVGYRIH